MKKYLLFSCLFIITTAFINNCGYQLSGHGSQIPKSIKTIYIPNFDNKTIRVQAEQFVTYAVKEEFIRRSRLKLVANKYDADSILEGTIEKFDVIPITFGAEGSANLYRLNITLSARFIDLQTGKILFEGENINFKEAYNIDDDEFFSQETEKLIQISQRFAESVVVTILEDF